VPQTGGCLCGKIRYEITETPQLVQRAITNTQVRKVTHLSFFTGRQDAPGAMGLWEMNGTNVAAMVNLPNPTAAWQSVKGHPIVTG
jgi:hypothetical protein